MQYNDQASYSQTTIGTTGISRWLYFRESTVYVLILMVNAIIIIMPVDPA